MKLTKKNIKKIIYHVSLLIMSFIMFYPILWLFASSFKEESEIFMNASSLIPSRMSIDNFIEGWKGFAGTTFTTFFKNSFLYTIVGTIGEIISCIVVAYGFSRIKFVGRKVWFTCMILTMMLPKDIIFIPKYVLFSKIGWLNSFFPLLVPTFFAATPFFIYLTMQFIQGIPRELDEAARIDGCTQYSIFFRVIMPLITPAIISILIFSFYWKWQEFLGPMLYLQRPELYTVSIALKLFSDPEACSNWGAMLAMSALSLLPVFLIFIIFQKHLVEGVSASGLKG